MEEGSEEDQFVVPRLAWVVLWPEAEPDLGGDRDGADLEPVGEFLGGISAKRVSNYVLSTRGRVA